jgi:hypothetical protein
VDRDLIVGNPVLSVFPKAANRQVYGGDAVGNRRGANTPPPGFQAGSLNHVYRSARFDREFAPGSQT